MKKEIVKGMRNSLKKVSSTPNALIEKNPNGNKITVTRSSLFVIKR